MERGEIILSWQDCQQNEPCLLSFIHAAALARCSHGLKIIRNRLNGFRAASSSQHQAKAVNEIQSGDKREAFVREDDKLSAKRSLILRWDYK